MLFVRKLFHLSTNHSWQCITVFIVFYFVILIGGAAIFKAIEEPAEQASFNKLSAHRNAFMQQIKSSCGTKVTENDVDEFLNVVLFHGAQGVKIFQNYTSHGNWGLPQAIFFAGSVVSTLGYGQTTYLTKMGKLFTIFYVSIGVPFTLFFFTACVYQINRIFIWQQQKLANCLPSATETQVKIIHFLMTVFVFFILLLIVPAAIFTGIEKSWNFLDSFYFCFISMTTVGMTDQLPGDSPDQPVRPLYKLSLLVYLFVGLIGVLAGLRLFTEIASDTTDCDVDASSLNTFQPQPLKEQKNNLDDSQGKRDYNSINELSSSAESSP